MSAMFRKRAQPVSTISDWKLTGHAVMADLADIHEMSDAPSMALEPLWTGSELLHKLLSDYLEGSIGTALFCDNFETAFNFDVDHRQMTPIEERVFRGLFREVVYYSPFPEERAKIRNYRSEEEIRQAAKDARAQLHPSS